MAALAIILGSMIGGIGGLVAWLFSAVSLGTAFAIYLGFGLVLPVTMTVVSAFVTCRTAPTSAAPLSTNKADRLAA